MPLYAHALIEVGDTKYPRGSEVPEDLSGLEELKEFGSVSEDEYTEPEPTKPQPPETVELDGVVYKRAYDGADTEDSRDA
jgi:hypothetical protein